MQSTRHNTLLLVIAAMCLCVCAPIASAQVPRAGAEVVKRSSNLGGYTRQNVVIYVGEQFYYRVVVQGTTTAQTPRFNLPDEIRPTGSTDYSSVNTGNPRSSRQEFYIGLIASRAGNFRIEPAQVDVGGRVVNTNAVMVEIRNPAPGDAEITIETPTGRVYVGQPVNIISRLKLDTGAPRQRPMISAPPIPEGATAVDAFADPRFRGYDYEGLTTIFGSQAPFAYPIDRTRRDCIIPIGVVFEQAGRYVFGPLELTYAIESPVRRRATARSEPAVVEVVEPPLENRPPSFNGFVGPAEIKSGANAERAKVGDPITLTLEMDAPLLAERLQPPDLARQRTFKEFAIDPEGWRMVETDDTTRKFEIVVRPQSTSIERIPPVEFSTFDPLTETYRTVTSDPSMLDVEDAPPATIDEFGAIASDPLLDGPGGVRANFDARTHDMLGSESSRVTDHMSPFAWILALATPPAIWLILTLASSRLTPARRAARRSRRAANVASRRLTTAGSSPDRIATAIRGYLADRFMTDASAMTEVDCVRLIRSAGGDPTRARELARTLATAEAPRYTSETVGAEPPSGPDTASLIASIEEDLKLAAKGDPS